MLLTNIPQTLIQPSGEIIQCYASGDEYFNYLHDVNGYIIIQDTMNGYYSYAKYTDNQIVSSNYIVTNSLIKSPLPYDNAIHVNDIKNPKLLLENISVINYNPSIVTAPSKGTLDNIVVFIRFSDESEFSTLISDYNDMFNNSNINYDSMYNYFKTVSYNNLLINSYFFPQTSGLTVLSYKATKPRRYYQPYNSATNPNGYKNSFESSEREQSLLKSAVSYISSQVSKNLNIDANLDSFVDSICFIIKGSPDTWNSLLWPHKSNLNLKKAYINGKTIMAYNLQLENTLLVHGISILCHEMYHILGCPNLYHYSFDGLNPVSYWDLMGSILNPPQHTTAYIKWRYTNWINDIPEIIESGTYTLNPLTFSTNNCYKIRTPLSSKEYFVLEYRNNNSIFETALPGSGLLVYRINTANDGKGNSLGPTDEIYVFRPNGTITNDGHPLLATLSSNVNRTSIGGPSNPLFLSDGRDSGLEITNIGVAGNTISFYVKLN